ncbi:thioredoxin reductase 2, mitochondrial-like isoform X2 [Varroa jacobsoni]|uniref:thioredoxin-disulfide reductase (NADPH) n=1 Tax=Varroa destructor TaxID=109461 RepID=A0A7M7KI81_VARDE|nr:thioredoxin reductase 2, mitochondrial-like isoform X1 [Varroa destructor]XP_022667208.1 thioredoxin reductase 2, mitochondrial-like isoform X1 [Varroa destructor]XP_022708685.1 thioredoxin reductase 2, mitochondrial-like isoform X2 [Varroa jacobsoni]
MQVSFTSIRVLSRSVFGSFRLLHVSAVRPSSMAPIEKTKDGYDYDFVVIGGGSGGLASAKEAAALGLKTAVLNYVTPSTQNTTWGLGGTCVNVGCIPKKLYHTAALLGDELKDARKYGWEFSETLTHNWDTLRSGVTDYIKSLNWIHRVSLRNAKIDYYNMEGSFIDVHTVKMKSAGGAERQITSKWFLLSVGGRPTLPDDVPGAKEYAITSDDIFHMQNAPGKTFVVGGSYVALECAGFLTGLGYETQVCLRSIPLRGFDQQMAGMVVDYMEKHGTKFHRGCVPTLVEKQPDGKFHVEWKNTASDEVGSDTFDSVLFAIGRHALTKVLNLEAVGVKTDSKGKVITDDEERTTASNIYALGDILVDKPELTPVAARTGRLIARRLAGTSTEKMNYDLVATTVFTPIEYACCGLSEEDAIKKYGQDNIEVWHSFYKPHTFPIAERSNEHCYIKYIGNIKENNKIIGMHFLGQMAGEVMQGFAAAMKVGITRAQIEETIGIHPTVAEEIVKVDVTKRSGIDPTCAKCCG